jgi:UDP-N-acetylglucosamine 1-carboxyvinyltransferase
MDGDEVNVDSSSLKNDEASYELVSKMRASILVMGPLLARLGKAKVSLPGGCAIGSRPIDIHLKGLEKLGAKIKIESGYVELETTKLKGTEIYLDYPSVGATENILMAATLAEGTTIINEAAKEPEVVDLANFLNLCGARVKGAGQDTIIVEGVKRLEGASYRVIPDRIEAGTFMVAASITGGELLIENVQPRHLGAVITRLRETGAKVEIEKDFLRVVGSDKVLPVDIKTLPYPGFPTDMQAQFMALLSIAQGVSFIMETVFENRFMHVDELNRMGALIRVDNHLAIITGVPYLSGAPVTATDLRASAALILAGLVARGRTEVFQIHHLDRGYESIEKKFSAIGAKIKRVEGREEDA